MAEIDENEFYRRAIAEAIDRNGTNVYALSKAAGISGSGLRDILSGKVSSTTVDKLWRIAKALDIPVRNFFSEPGTPHSSQADAAPNNPPDQPDTETLQFLSIRGVVQAGVWIEEDSVEFDDAELTVPIVPDPRFGAFGQYALKVRGDSMNKVIADGEFAHVVDVATVRDWQHNDIVVVERTRAGGVLRETTLKQVVITKAGELQLWPRSTDPRWQEPITMNDVDDEDMQVQLKGLVIGKYSPLLKR